MFLFALAVFAASPFGAALIFLAAVVLALKTAQLAKILLWLASLAPFLFGTTIAYPGYGSHLASGGTAGTSYTNVAQLKSVKFGGLKADFDDITNLDSPTISGAVFKEYIKTLVDGSDVTFDGVMNPADPTTQALLTNLETGGLNALYFWKVTLTDGSVLVFQGYVSDFKFGAEYSKAITFSGGIKIVGTITATWS
jgi:Lambda phage tail tube protein, TTP